MGTYKTKARTAELVTARRFLALVFFCYGVAVMADTVRVLPPGVWGGEHVILEVTERGGELEFDCARGRFDGSLHVDSRGRFDVTGIFTPEHAGPIRREDRVVASNTRYLGQVSGKTMTLTVVVGDNTAGSFTLVEGARPRLKKCR